MSKRNGQTWRQIAAVLRHSDRLCARIFRSERGATVIEFAIVAPILIALLIATLETALVYFAQENLDTVASTMSRKIMTGQIQSSGTSATQFKSQVCQTLPVFMTCNNVNVDVQSATSFDAIDTSNPTIDYDNDGNMTTSFAFNTGSAGSIVVVRVMYYWPVTIAPLGFGLKTDASGKHLLVSTAVYKTEPFAQGAT